MDDKVIRIKKAIDFFRKFDYLSDKELYRKSVLKFCELVEEYLKAEEEDKFGKGSEMFKDIAA